VERRPLAKSGSEMAWWQWVDARMKHRLDEYSKAVGQAEFGDAALCVSATNQPRAAGKGTGGDPCI
jgi:hypothetical protein